MTQKLLFVLQQYSLLLLFALSAWGWGRSALRVLRTPELGGEYRHPAAMIVGFGWVIVLLQGLGIAGMLNSMFTALILAAGGSLCVVEMTRIAWRSALANCYAAWRAHPSNVKCAWVAAGFLWVSTLASPLRPPSEWDELMYHLPHAAQWARTGTLTVNGWLRYPWFPYNFNLLYASALVLGSDVLPHLLHALAGWITTLLLYQWARPHFGSVSAVFAAMIWLLLARGQFGNAYIDLAVAMFALFSFVCLARWIERKDLAWLTLASWGLGLAIGTKYQALTLLPFFAVAVLFARPAPRQLLVPLVAFCLPCIYWYGRNFVLAGDPVAPLGGKMLGFSDWNLTDYRAQFEDLRRVASVPPIVVWPCLLGVAFHLARSRKTVRLAAAYGAYALVVWALTSRYPRYLLLAYPVLAIFAVAGYHCALQSLARHVSDSNRERWTRLASVAVLMIAMVAPLPQLRRHWMEIAYSAQSRDALLVKKVTGYRMWAYLRERPAGRIYQFAMEDAIYYAPNPIWGEVFGPWRYSDYAALDAPALHKRLSAEGFDSLLIHTGRAGNVVAKADFDRHFSLVHEDGEVKLFTFRKVLTNE